MMAPQSLQFIEGYVFNTLDRRIFKHRNETKEGDINNFKEEASVPFLWFGVTNPTLDVLPARVKVCDVLAKVNDEVCQSLDKKLKCLYSKLKFSTIAVQDRQYVQFVTTVLDDKRKLTVSEIERLLGYGVEIIAEHEVN